MEIKIGLNKQEERVPELIYGQFIEHALDCIEGGIHDSQSKFADENGIRTDVVELIKQLAPPIIRFPGGTIMCQYHWEDAVGPKENRIWRKNLIWGGELNPEFGTAEFVSLCRQVGAEPMICVNMESGTPEEAGNWVEYCNGTGNSYYAQLRRSHGYEEPFHVKYWCIGNESFAEPDMGIHHDVNCYTRDAMEFIKRMKLTDDTIKTVIVGNGEEKWDKPVLDALHQVTDYFSLHHYSSSKGGDIYKPFEGEKHFKETLHKAAEFINHYPEEVKDFNPWYRFSPRKDKIKIAVDEWNIWDFEENKTYGLKPDYCWRDALWCAGMLNLFLTEPSVGMANMAQLVNVLAPIKTDKEGAWLQTIAYPLIRYRRLMKGTRVGTDFCSPVISSKEDIAALSIAAVQNESNIYVAVVNRDFEKNYEISFQGQEAYGISRLTVLLGSKSDAMCTRDESSVKEIQQEINESSIEIPSGSICFVQLLATNNLLNSEGR